MRHQGRMIMDRFERPFGGRGYRGIQGLLIGAIIIAALGVGGFLEAMLDVLGVLS